MPVTRRAVLTGEILTTYRRARQLMRSVDLAEALAVLRGGRPTRDAGLAADDQLFAAVRLGRAVMLVLARLPTDSRCLIRSLVVTSMLARRGIPARLVLGVRPDTDDPFLAHAWVEHAGLPVIPDEGYNRLHVL